MMKPAGFDHAPAACKPLIWKHQEKHVAKPEALPPWHGRDSGLSPATDSMEETPMATKVISLWRDDRGQDIAEYAVMLAVILVIVVGTIRLIGSNANNVFSSVASSVQ
jgi:Flp pilus assembly pilin Flp